jgi:hypothetical protein
MALNVTQFYNFKANTLLIGGFKIAGFGDDGGIEYEFGDDIHRHVSTADGQTVVSRVNDARVMATITLKETSAGYRRLALLLQQQLANPLAITPLPYVHRDPINGDLVTSSHVVFINYPEPSKSRDAGDREFQILLPYAALSIQFGTQNVF